MHTLKLYIFNIFKGLFCFLCVRVFACIYVHVPHVFGGQKRSSGPLELEL